MAFNLAALLGMGQAGAIPGVTPDEIIVDGSRNRANADIEGPDAPFMGNKRYLEEVIMTRDASPERSGAFGSRGTLRDILGTIGDAFLLQGGGERIYAPQRERERLSDAMVGFTGDQESANAALERMAYEDPAAAAEMYGQMQDAQGNQARIAQARAASEDLAYNRQSTRSNRALTRAAQLLAQPGAMENGVLSEQAYRMLTRIAAAEGTTPEALGINPGMTEREIALLSGSGMTVNQTKTLPLAERRTDVSERNALTAERNSRRPTRVAQPRSQTSLEYYQELTRGGRARTADEQAWIDDYLGGSEGRSSVPGAATGGGGGFSIRSVRDPG